MFNILDFIDSADIRRHNQFTRFSLKAQAVLIFCSHKRTVHEKLDAWKYLLNQSSDPTLSQRLVSVIHRWENALLRRYSIQNAVFELQFRESFYPDSTERFLFASYDEAFRHLQLLKKEYLEDDDLQEVSVEAIIQLKPLGKTSRCVDDTFYFDTDLQMIDLTSSDDASEFPLSDLEDFFIYIPLPFKKGDVLRTIGQRQTQYGVLSHDTDKSYFAAALLHGDRSDMILSLDQLCETDGHLVFEHDHFGFLDLEFCSDNELPGDQKNLLLLRDIYHGKMEIGELLHIYSHYGKDAYKIVSGKG